MLKKNLEYDLFDIKINQPSSVENLLINRKNP